MRQDAQARDVIVSFQLRARLHGSPSHFLCAFRHLSRSQTPEIKSRSQWELTPLWVPTLVSERRAQSPFAPGLEDKNYPIDKHPIICKIHLASIILGGFHTYVIRIEIQVYGLTRKRRVINPRNSTNDRGQVLFS